MNRAFTLQPLIANGVFHPGADKLSCCVGGAEYYAGVDSTHFGQHDRIALSFTAVSPPSRLADAHDI